MAIQTRIYRGKEQVLCAWRRRWVRLTPEEWVRQQLLHRLVDVCGYPHSLIAVEVPIHVGDAQRRCDAVVYAADMTPLMMVECKAENVLLTQKVLDQAVTYNRTLHVPYLLLHNGPQSVCVCVAEKEINYLQAIPTWNQLSSCTTR